MLDYKLNFHCLLVVLAVLFCGGALAQGLADNWPNRPVTFIVPGTPGGSIDIETRLYTLKLSENTGKSFIVEYKPGAGTTVGTAFVAKSAPNGYTILSAEGSYTIVPLAYKNLPYDPNKDLAPVSLMSKRGYMVLVNSSVPVKSLKEYLAYAIANPGTLNIATAGAGGVNHLGPAWLHSLVNAKVTYVHYKGGTPAYTAVISGEVNGAVFGSPVSLLPHVKAGKLRILAVSTAERISLLPDVPTVAESGYPGFDVSQWIGFVAPAGTPVPIINALNAELVKVAKSPDIVQKAAREGILMVGSTPDQFRQHMATESARWRKVVQDNGINLEE